MVSSKAKTVKDYLADAQQLNNSLNMNNPVLIQINNFV